MTSSPRSAGASKCCRWARTSMRLKATTPLPEIAPVFATDAAGRRRRPVECIANLASARWPHMGA